MGVLLEYDRYDALALANLVKAGEVSAEELLGEAMTRLARLNPQLNAVINASEPVARQLIGQLDRDSLFCGVPFLVKDLMLPISGFPMSNGSAAMKDWMPQANSSMADALNRAGLITFGKTTTSELGTSSLVNTRAFGETRNPWDLQLNAGGSSGGSSAAVAARIVPMAYSSDGGGSIRLPAAWCGIFGFKPSPGLNHYEDMSNAWGGAVVSHVSTRSVRDSAAYLDLVTGNVEPGFTPDNPPPESYLAASHQSPRRLRIALITAAPTDTAVAPECIRGAEQAARQCEALGHHIELESWGLDGQALMRAFLTVVLSSTTQDVKQMASLLGQSPKSMPLELVTRFMAELGEGVSAEQREAALLQWREAQAHFAEVFERYDLILTPAVAVPPQKGDSLAPSPLEALMMRVLLGTGFGRKLYSERLLNEIIQTSLYQTPFTPLANIARLPAMSVPLSWGCDGLPYGAHFIAANGQDRLLFQLAGQLEQHYSWRDRQPAITAI